MLKARISNAEVQTLSDGVVLIRWDTQANAEPLSLRLLADSAEDPSGATLLAENISGGEIRLEDLPRGRRHYFLLQAGDSENLRLAERVLPLEGAQNFRDLGGYSTQSGKRVAWGRLYRSDYLTHLSDADCEYLLATGLRTVFDLRSGMERRKYPSRHHPESCTHTLCWDDPHNAEKLGERLQQFREQNNLDFDDEMHGFLSHHYRRYLEVQAEKYQDILHHLVEEETAPALIHCTAGKDRTGIIVALILHLLGVGEADIMQDYLLTNQHVKGPDEQERFRLLLRQFGLEDVSDRVMDAMLYAHAEYLQAAFDGMREDYGSVEQYVQERLEFGSDKIARLQSMYLE